ncbi:MAG: drug/metabolite exporter YedA, partial [Myxococcota bacterium]
MSTVPPGRGVRVGLALAILWLVWGSTYLAVAQVLPAVPPFALSSVRFLVAAPLLGIGALATGAERPTARQVAAAAVVGAV